MPYFTHRKLVDWIDEAGKTLGYVVKSEKRRKTHGKIFQIDSMWFNDQQTLFAFFEAETRWEMNHIIGHLTCCTDYALQENVRPLFILVFLENDADHCIRLRKTWAWLTRPSLLPQVLRIQCLPIYMKSNEKRSGLHVRTITQKAFAQKIDELITSIGVKAITN